MRVEPETVEATRTAVAKCMGPKARVWMRNRPVHGYVSDPGEFAAVLQQDYKGTATRLTTRQRLEDVFRKHSDAVSNP